MGDQGILEVELVKPKKKPTDPNDILDDCLEFFKYDVPNVVEYIKENNIPPHFITLNRRIDLHPTRDYLLKIPRCVGEIVRVKKSLDDDGDELDNFFVP